MAQEAQQNAWLKPVIAGVVMALLCKLILGWGLLVAIIAGVVVGGIAHLVFGRSVDTAPASTPAPAPRAAAPTPTPTPAPEPAPAPEAEPVATPAAEAPAPEAALIKPSTPLPGEAELAARKGTWTYKPGSA